MHIWVQLTAPDGTRGYQCLRCRLTAFTVPVADDLADCRQFLLPRYLTATEQQLMRRALRRSLRIIA